MAPTRSKKRKSRTDVPAVDLNSETIQSENDSSSNKDLPVRVKRGEMAALKKSNMIVFGDEDEEEKEDDDVATQIPVIGVSSRKEAQPEEEEEEDDSDDEAPEAVSTTKAAEEVKKSSQAAKKAAQEQAAAQKRKRQQRDELFKKQAEERKKAEHAVQEQRAVPSSHGQDSEEDEEDEDEDENEGAGNDGTTAVAKLDETRAGRRRMTRSQIPDLLPTEFLTDSSDDSEEEEYGGAPGGTRTKRRRVAGVEKRLSRLDRGPRDEVVGATIYRVAKKVDQRLAPKSKKHTKSSKDLLLKRERPVAKARGGFLVKK